MMRYLLIGHVSKDLTPEGPHLGGTVSFAGPIAQAAGWETAILTAASIEMTELLLPLRSFKLEVIASPETTTFRNDYRSEGRQQYLFHHGEILRSAHLPDRFKHPDIVHFAPVAGEIEPGMIDLFPDSLRCATLQGWLRAWGDEGLVRYQRWEKSAEILPELDASVLSIEDLGNDEEEIGYYASLSPLLVVTRGREGCSLFVDGRSLELPTHHIDEVDPTGAGDIFATAFFTDYHHHRDPVLAAKFALYLATESCQYSGLPRQESINKAKEAVYGS